MNLFPSIFRKSLLAIALAMVPMGVSAQFAYGEPRGIYVVKLPGKSAGETQKRTYLGMPLMSDTRFAGLVETVNGDLLSLQGISSHQDIQDATRPSFVHVMDGAGRGFITDIVEFRQNDIRCAVNLAPWMAAGTVVRIRPHPNVVQLFGANNRFALAAGSSAELADNIVAWDAAAQQEKVYYYHSTRQRWEEKDVNANAGAAVLRFPYGIYIIRRSTGNLRMTLSGEISGAPILLPVRTGVNVFSLPINLSSSLSNLIPATGDFPAIAGVNATQADLVTLEEPYSGLQRGPFYLSSRPGSTGWREVGDNSGNDISAPLDYLSTLIIRRSGPAGYVRVEGSLDPGPGFSPPADPDAGETALTGELPYRPLPGSPSYKIEVSTDLQNWSDYADPVLENNVAKFQLPGGQGRAFYRLRITLDF